jgi:hypothetical protein
MNIIFLVLLSLGASASTLDTRSTLTKPCSECLVKFAGCMLLYSQSEEESLRTILFNVCGIKYKRCASENICKDKLEDMSK